MSYFVPFIYFHSSVYQSYLSGGIFWKQTLSLLVSSTDPNKVP